MARAIAVRGGGATDPVAGTLTLTHDERHRRRRRFEHPELGPIHLDLAEALVLRDGDALELEDGRLIAIRAAPEPVLVVTAKDAHALLRLAWHLGNRHLAVEIQPDRLVIRADHVIADMLRGLGATVTARDAPFTPEGGAYASEPHHH